MRVEDHCRHRDRAVSLLVQSLYFLHHSVCFSVRFLVATRFIPRILYLLVRES